MQPPDDDFIGDPRDLEIVVPTFLKSLGPAGSALAAAWTAYKNRQRDKRIDQAFTKIRTDLASGHHLNEFAKSQAGMQLFESVMERIEREHSERKRERFANIIIMSWITNDPPEGLFDEALLFAAATADFTDTHIGVLKELYDSGPNGRDGFATITHSIKAASNKERDEIGLLVIFDLCSRYVFARRGWGMNDPDFKGSMLLSQNLSPENMAFKCNHAITARGQRYVDFVIRGPSALCQEAISQAPRED